MSHEFHRSPRQHEWYKGKPHNKVLAKHRFTGGFVAKKHIYDMIVGFVRKHKLILIYSACMSLLLFLLKWLELRLIIIDHSFEIYVGSIALIFTVFGIWLATKLISSRITIVEKKVYTEDKPVTAEPDITEIQKMGLSKREMEVLSLMAAGASNQEIADTLFISLATVKTHASRIFEKMDVKRRTQAIEKAQKTGLIV